MKKQILSIAALASVAAIAFTPTMARATSFDCSKAAIWAYDGGDHSLRKINPFGDVVSTVTLDVSGSGSGDVAISADYAHAFIISPDNGVESYNTRTGALDSSYPKAITGPWIDDANGDDVWTSAAGVIDGGNVIVNGYNQEVFYSINPNTGVSTIWADLAANGDAGLPAGGLTGGSWTAGADVVQAVDGSIYVLASNSNYPDANLLVKVDPADTTQMTVVGSLPAEAAAPWGLARAGDNMYITDSDGTHLYQLGAIPNTASVETLTAVDAGNFGEGRLWGLAGTNDSSPSATHCTFDVNAGPTSGLANTGGSFSDYFGLTATGAGLVVAGAYLAIARRRESK